MKNYVHNYKYFYGVEITEEEIKNGWINYRTLAKTFDAVMCNDITKLLVETVGAGHRNGIRVCLSIQGYGEETKNFSNCAADNNLRVKLAKSMVDAVIKYRLDGLDIDWEYPGSYSGRGFVEDRANYTLLIKEIRKQLDAVNKDYLLTAAIPAGPWGHNNFDLGELSDYFDYKIYLNNELTKSLKYLYNFLVSFHLKTYVYSIFPQ